MAETPPEIQIYALFPLIAAPGAGLDLDPSNWRWVHCLTFPINTLRVLQFSRRPFKWFCYSIGVVVGAEGNLFSSSHIGSNMVVDYDAGLPAQTAMLYYHVSDEEKRRMFPINPNIQRTSITSSALSTRRDHFRQGVAVRDGNQCILTGIEPDLCQAAHLLAHSKGDSYIETYTQRRSRDPACSDIIHDVNSVRNGLFLNATLRLALVQNKFAFLMTPNFAMTTADVDTTSLGTEKRCVAYVFEPQRDFLPGTSIPLGSSVQISDTQWPPAILLDAVYASALLHHFGTQELKDTVTSSWGEIFNPGGIMTTDEREEMIRLQAQNRTSHHEAAEASRGPDTLDMLMALPYIMVPRETLQGMLKENEEKAKAIEQRRVDVKVNLWMEQVDSV